ncbi:hypothetical protein RUM43_002807 [Polyplax serrata]|uniref:Uncharacterized protein n=1 Tax=Polyplax serrata TaxID=468196 RepID=A0AAN8P2N4_POLSC
MNLRPGSIPPTTHEIRISNAKHLRVLPGTFFNNSKLHRARLAFQNLTSPSFHMIIEDNSRVTIEEYAFRNLQSPVTATVVNCGHVVLKKSIFYWFVKVKISNVPKLELVENTFSTKVKQDNVWNEATMLFLNVTLNEIPNATFPLNSAKIVFTNCTISTIRSEAFNGIALVSVSFKSSKIKRIQGGAFSERTLLQNFELDDVDVEYVDSNAVSAAARFTVQNCRMEELTNGAFNVNTAYLKVLDNHFRKIRRYAFEIHNWNSIVVNGNRFENLEPDFFSAPFSNITDVTIEFIFSNNSLGKVEVDVLSFVPNEPGLKTVIDSNIFENVCHCHLETWVQERAGASWEEFYGSSYCVIGELLENCYNISRGYMKMKEYVVEYCTPENVIICEDAHKTYHPNILLPLDLHNTERTVLGVIFLGVLCSIALMIVILTLIWMKEKGICGSKRKSQSSNSNSCCFHFCARLCSDGNLVRCDSISRMNIHEYAEIQNQLNHQQKQTTLTVEDEIEGGEDIIECENKATQTIPEELTQELIQSLREKLDDPENYNEARDMIEHLYDLIKVEESCNNNASPRNSFTFDDEEVGGIYEVIQTTKTTSLKKPRTRRKNLAVNVTSTGTRAPSPDKLSPISFNVIRPTPTVVGDYTEPRDRRSNEYCELPSANLIMPDVLTSSQIKNGSNLPNSHIYAEPLQCTSMTNRPLPTKPVQPGTSKS